MPPPKRPKPRPQAPERASRRPRSPAGDAPAPPSAEAALQEVRSPRKRVRAFLSLGSNLGDRREHLSFGVAHLPDVVAVSPVYETDPVGGPPGQGSYLNLVVELSTARSARELLMAAQTAEAAAGRTRVERWGPRTLDIDVLLVGDEKVEEPDLIIPHPRMWERGFVLVPLADLAPELVIGYLTSEMARGVRAAGRLET